MATATIPPPHTRRPADEGGPFVHYVLPALLLTALAIAVVVGIVWLVRFVEQARATIGSDANFVFRRLEEPVKLTMPGPFGMTWVGLLIPVLLVTLGYLVWMYIRDGKAVDWPWANFFTVARLGLFLGFYFLPGLFTVKLADPSRDTFFRGGLWFLLALYVAGVVAQGIWKFRSESRSAGPLWAGLLGVLRVNAFLLLPALLLAWGLTPTPAGTARTIEINPYWFWLPILVPAMVGAFFYLAWMYIRDGRAIGWLWATFLGALRSVVYVVLLGVFLLPALQKWEKSESHSKVLLLVDLSGSMRVTDEQPNDNTPLDKLPTRLDKIAQLLSDQQAAFLGRVLEKNPVTVYGFGGQLDEEFRVFAKDGPQWTAEEWKAWLTIDPKAWLFEGVSLEGKEKVLASLTDPDVAKMTPEQWCEAWRLLDVDQAIPATLHDADKALLHQRRDKLGRKLELRSLMLSGTNLAESTLMAFNRESNHMLAGVIVISDGRKNQGSDSAFEELRGRLGKAKVPLFAVAVGEDRIPVAIRILGLQAPEQAPPDDKFPVRVEVEGDGLADKEFKVSLDIYPPGAEKPALTIDRTGKFVQGEPPHAQVEFIIDPNEEAFATLRKPPEKDKPGRPEFPEGEWKLIARVPRERREIFPKAEHESNPTTLQIVKKPLRILLMTGGPTREYQFCRTLFDREVTRKRAELSIYLQKYNPATDFVQDVDPYRLLHHFPNVLRVEDDAAEKPDEKYYNLAQYDLILCFDLDWTRAQPEELALLQKWVDTQAGGLVLVGGPIHTYQLVRGVNFERIKPLIELYPVTLDDNRLQGLEVNRKTDQPWPLKFLGVTPELEFLRLDEDRKEATAGWDEYFAGKSKAEGGSGERRGFYNYYPVKSVKPSAGVIATFTDPRAMMPDGKEQPFMVTMPFGKGRVVYLSSGEFWRLRQFKQIYHERFWTKLARYASAGTQTRITRRGDLLMYPTYTAGRQVTVEAQLLDGSLSPLPKTIRAEGKLVPPTGVKLRDQRVEFQAKPGQGDWAGWFRATFMVRAPGEYRLDLPVPGSTDTLSRKFLVTEANLEMDNTRPDFAQMELLAGSVADLQTDDRKRSEFKELVSKQLLAARSKDAEPRLLFDLQSAERIPEALISASKTQRNRGDWDDLWDDGITLDQMAGRPDILSTVLILVVALLSIEWLTRKLLRLA